MKRLLFVLLTGLLVAVFLFALMKDQTREWTVYQRKFFSSLHKDERRGLAGGIKQLQVTELHRIDRCTTCHLAIDKPQLALAEEPFKAHPGNFLETHPPEKFGCTICHGGQGLATEVQDAHGFVEHWEQPLLTGEFVQASCQKCHGDLQPIRNDVPKLIQGQALYKKLGCAGCHTVHGFGQTVSVDLSDIGDKPWQLLDFTFVRGEPTEAQWLHEHFREPRQITPGFGKDELPPGEEEVYPTFMPNFGLSEDDAKALTIYMLGLSAETFPSTYVLPPAAAKIEPPPSSPVEAGKLVFEKYGCIGCHGQAGSGGRRNFNSQLGQEVPSLVNVKSYYDRAALKEFIQTGRQPVPRQDASRPRPPSYMPAWKDRIPDQELETLVDYVLSLNDRVIPEPATAPAAGDAAPESP